MGVFWLGGYNKKMPTQFQLLVLFQHSLFLTDAYISIHLVRVDERSKNVVILAGEEIEIEINPNGRSIIR